jgi:hypothetical protein
MRTVDSSKTWTSIPGVVEEAKLKGRNERIVGGERGYMRSKFEEAAIAKF